MAHISRYAYPPFPATVISQIDLPLKRFGCNYARATANEDSGAAPVILDQQTASGAS
jgi:hypothetical protein